MGKQPTPIEIEKTFLKKISKFYFGGLIIMYASIFFFAKVQLIKVSSYILPNIEGGALGNLLSSALILSFFIPIGLIAIYILRALYCLFKRQWESFQLALTIIVIGLIIGFGVCLSNFAIVKQF